MPTYGPWREDSIPVWRQSAWASTEFENMTSGWESKSDVTVAWDVDPDVDAAWRGTGGSGPVAVAGYRTLLDVHWNDTFVNGTNPRNYATWAQAWLSVTRLGSFAVSEGQLPAGIYDDPTVIGVEWEPTSTALEQRLKVELRAGGSFQTSAEGDPDRRVFVKNHPAYPGTAEYAPVFIDGATFAEINTLGTFTANESALGSVTIDNPPVPPSGEVSLPVSLLDAYTQAQIPPERPANAVDEHGWVIVDLRWQARLEGLYAPRFRLIYESPARKRVAPPCRIFPREDGLGFGGGRIFPPPKSQQRSNRWVGYY